MTRQQLAQYFERHPPSPLDLLEEREMEAFSILAQGGGASSVSRELNIPETEANELTAQILRKLKLREPVGILQLATQHR